MDISLQGIQLYYIYLVYCFHLVWTVLKSWFLDVENFTNLKQKSSPVTKNSDAGSRSDWKRFLNFVKHLKIFKFLEVDLLYLV